MGRIPCHEHKNAAKGSKEVTIQIDSSVRLHDDSKRWNFRRGEEDNEDEESDEESDESGSPVAVMADSQHRSANINTKKKKKKKQTNEEGEEWGESQQKKDIIAAFLDRDSGIHELTTTQIFEDYAADHGWVKLNATNNIRRLRKQYE
eukprot:scaffold33530_cov119-Skeletonema_dohrnii-CCMP3373.AAC.13